MTAEFVAIIAVGAAIFYALCALELLLSRRLDAIHAELAYQNRTQRRIDQARNEKDPELAPEALLRSRHAD